MFFHLFETPAIRTHTIALTLMVQIAFKAGVHKQSGSSMFLWNYCYPSTMFLGPKVQALVQDERRITEKRISTKILVLGAMLF